MSISRNGSRPTQKGPPEHFTGTVRVDPLFASSPPARAAGAYVTFEPVRAQRLAHAPARLLMSKLAPKTTK